MLRVPEPNLIVIRSLSLLTVTKTDGQGPRRAPVAQQAVPPKRPPRPPTGLVFAIFELTLLSQFSLSQMPSDRKPRKLWGLRRTEAVVLFLSAGGVFSGRGALFLLGAGLAALVLASALSFGLVAAITIVGALTLSYFILNVLLGRRKNERAAATFLRRALTNATTLVAYNRNGGVRRYPARNARLRRDDRSYHAAF